MATPSRPDREPLSLRGLKTLAARVFDESRDAMRDSIVLRLQSDFLKRGLGQSLGPVPKPRQAANQAAAFNKLSPREISVVRLIVEGKTTREIASELGIAFKTAAAHRSHIMSKLEVTNSAAVVREAFHLGILEE